MPPQSAELLIGILMMSLAGASIGTWFVLFRRLREGPLLPWEPRRPVPWGAIGPLLIALFVLSRIVSVIFGDGSPQLADFDSPREMLEQIVGSVVAQFVLFGSFFAAVAVLSGATLRDIGLPMRVEQFVRDVGIGFTAWLAALVPVYGLQAIFVTATDAPSSHPLIEVVLKNPNWLVIVLAFLSAVVVAPLSEEIVFRLLLQGWLEKLEDKQIGWQRVPQSVVHTTIVESTGEQVPLDEIPPPDESLEPPSRGLFGLPYGWFPIIISATLFALAHLGHGPDPIPLCVLAMILGYMYQRTHRIVPCIVTHLLFNFTTLVMLGLSLLVGAKLP